MRDAQAVWEKSIVRDRRYGLLYQTRPLEYQLFLKSHIAQATGAAGMLDRDFRSVNVHV